MKKASSRGDHSKEFTLRIRPFEYHVVDNYPQPSHWGQVRLKFQAALPVLAVCCFRIDFLVDPVAQSREPKDPDLALLCRRNHTSPSHAFQRLVMEAQEGSGFT